MRRRLFSFATLIALVACNSGGNVPSPQPQRGGCGTETRNVVYVSAADAANPNGDGAQAAVTAYRHHVAVVLCDGELSALAKLLGITDPGSVSAAQWVTVQSRSLKGKHPVKSRRQPPATPPPLPSPEPTAAAPMDAVGFHLSKNGVVESFYGFVPDDADEAEAVDDWVSDVDAHAQEPSIGSWQPVFTNTETIEKIVDGNRFVVQLSYVYYRLNNFNTRYDWYMETERELGTPKWIGCDWSILKKNGYVGYYNSERLIFMAPSGKDVVLYEHAPKTTESTKTASFSIGASLGKLAGGVHAEYGQSWSQPDVTIVDRTKVPTAYQEVRFSQPDLPLGPPAGCPAQTARSTFVAPHASIFQVPQGGRFNVESTSVMRAALMHTIHYCFCIPPEWRWYWSSPGVAPHPIYEFKQPVFKASSEKVILSPDHRKAMIHIAARSGDSNVAWQINNQPYWVVLSQTHGLGNKDITVEAQASTPYGSVANLNFDTDPRGGANNVETGPLILRVEFHK